MKVLAERALDRRHHGRSERAVTGHSGTRRHGKQQEVTHAGGDVGGDYIKGGSEAQTGIAVESGNRLRRCEPLHDEDRLHEMRDRERRFRAEIAKMRRAAHPQL